MCAGTSILVRNPGTSGNPPQNIGALCACVLLRGVPVCGREGTGDDFIMKAAPHILASCALQFGAPAIAIYTQRRFDLAQIAEQT